MIRITRRSALGGLAGFLAAPAVLADAAGRPRITDGPMSGDMTTDSAVVWSRADRPARLLAEWSTAESFAKSHRIQGADARPDNDFTATATLAGLPAGQTVFYRLHFETAGGSSAPVTGRLRMPPAGGGHASFVFGGDQVGAGWGINPHWGGLRVYDGMLRTDPDFLVHLGDRIYADNVLQREVPLGDGTIWRNIVTEAKTHVAQTLDDYRGNYRYNLLDAHVRRFNAAVPQLITWDDHEVANNWWPGRRFGKAHAERRGYATRDVDVLAARGRKAFFEYTPVGDEAVRAGRIWRSRRYGPLVEVFLLDGRSYRSPNRRSGAVHMAADATLLGPAQVDWLKGALARSPAMWKVIGNPLPIAHVRHHDSDRGNFDKYADGDPGAPNGREREIAEILSFIKQNGIRNVVWITADVHYGAAHRFHPDRAAFKEFEPFWEFVAGPFHTRPGRPASLDGTFGPERFYISTEGVMGNPPPSAGWCSFGHGRIDAASGALTVSLRTVEGRVLYQRTIEPAH